MTNKQKFAEIYAESFKECYPQFDISKAEILIKKAITTAMENIRIVAIDAPAFKLTSKKLGIKNTYKAYEEFFNN